MGQSISFSVTLLVYTKAQGPLYPRMYFWKGGGGWADRRPASYFWYFKLFCSCQLPTKEG